MNKKRKQVIKKLLEKIQSGEIVSNNRLFSEREIAEVMGETRSIIRDGLIALDAMGVIDIKDRYGIFISANNRNVNCTMLKQLHDWPADVLSRAMEVRQIIEPIASAISASRRNDKDIEKMSICIEHMEKLSYIEGQDAANSGAYWNTAFHTIIVESTDNAYLSRIYENVISAIEQEMSIMRFMTPPSSEGGRIAAFREHLDLYKLILDKDQHGAEMCAKHHLEHTINALIQTGRIVPSSNLFEQNLV